MSSDLEPVTFLNTGAIIQRLVVDPSIQSIVQGFPKETDYAKYNTPYFGETIGRVANRLANAALSAGLNGGEMYSLAANNGPHTLHGGHVGWGKRVWKGPEPVDPHQVPELGEWASGGQSLRFTLVSEHGDEGFPGEVEARVVYTVGKQKTDSGKEAVVLAMEYEAELLGGADETVVNMTNHSYFNLSSEPTILGTKVTLATTNHLPVDEGGIPTDGPTPFTKYALEPRIHFTLDESDPKIDHCFVVNTDAASVPIDTRAQPLTKLVEASHPNSGVHLEVYSTEPAFQFYTGEYINVPEIEGAPARGARSGFCIEPSRYVNAPNVDSWKGMTVLKKGETYGSRIVYRAWKE